MVYLIRSEAIHQMGEHFHALDNEMNMSRKKWSQSDEAIIQLNNRLCAVCQTNWEKLWIEIENMYIQKMRKDETMACLVHSFHDKWLLFNLSSLKFVFLFSSSNFRVSLSNQK